MGGVTTGHDALEFVACGALHVALGTVLFSDPYAPSRVRDELARAGEAVYGVAHDAEKSLEFRAKVVA
jgi:dihydroorotate dehydrogenase